MTTKKITSRVLVFNSAGKVLLVQRAPYDDKPDLWDLPGGKIEQKDFTHRKPKKACAKRELYEETGLLIKVSKLKSEGCYFHPLKNKLFCLFSSSVKGKPKIKLSKEHVRAAWHGLNELPQDMNPSTLILIRAVNFPCKLAA